VRKERDRYWEALRGLRAEYLETNKGQYDLTARPTMHYYAEQKYGFKMGLSDTGEYTADYTVTDEKKFMLFKIAYWK